MSTFETIAAIVAVLFLLGYLVAALIWSEKF